MAGTSKYDFYLYLLMGTGGGIMAILKRGLGTAFVFITIVLNPDFAYTQACCGPGGAGGGTPFFVSGGGSGVGYRLKTVRHYAYSARHPGFMTGLESAGLTDKSEVGFTPRLEYFRSLEANDRSIFDIYGGAFYTVFLYAPHSHQINLSENIAWRFVLTKNSRLVLRVDNENLAVFFPEESGIKYAVTAPSVMYSIALGFGDISVYAGFPVTVEPETRFASWAALEYEHPIGLGVSFSPYFDVSKRVSYSGITFTAFFAYNSFYAKAALPTNGDFTTFKIQPYLEYTLRNFVFWGGAELSIQPDDKFSANPFVGLAYNFYKPNVCLL